MTTLAMILMTLQTARTQSATQYLRKLRPQPQLQVHWRSFRPQYHFFSSSNPSDDTIACAPPISSSQKLLFSLIPPPSHLSLVHEGWISKNVCIMCPGVYFWALKLYFERNWGEWFAWNPFMAGYNNCYFTQFLTERRERERERERERLKGLRIEKWSGEGNDPHRNFFFAFA